MVCNHRVLHTIVKEKINLLDDCSVLCLVSVSEKQRKKSKLSSLR